MTNCLQTKTMLGCTSLIFGVPYDDFHVLRPLKGVP